MSVPKAHYYKSKKYLNLDMLLKAGLCLKTEYETSKNRRKHLCLLKNEKMEVIFNAENREKEEGVKLQEDANFSFKAKIFDAENDDCNGG
jgi:hypothetical protein